MYRRTQNVPNVNIRQKISPVSSGGVNEDELEQILDPRNCLICDNWDIKAKSILSAVKGHVETFEVAGETDKITMLKEFFDDMWIYAVGKKVQKYVPSTDTHTLIHTFTTTNKFDGAKAGDYFMICNGDTRIGVINAAGTTFTENSDTNTPKANVLWLHAGRLFSNSTADDGVYWSDVYQGSGAPYQDYTPAATPPLVAESWYTFKEGAGQCTGFGSLDNDVIFVLFEKGRAKFKLDVTTNDTDTRQIIITAFEAFNSSGGSRALTTTKGVVYATFEGIFLAPLGQPLLKEDINISVNMGRARLEKFNFSDADFVEFEETLWVTLRDNADNNNLIAKYTWKFGAWSYRKSIKISNFMPIGNKLYGASSVESIVYQLESGYSDLGENVRSEYLQPFNTPYDWTRIETLIKIFLQGKLSPASYIEVSIDRILETGAVQEKVKTYTWGTTGLSSGGVGIGDAGIGIGGIGGSSSGTGDPVLSRADKSPYIKNAAGLRLRIVRTDKVESEIHSFKFATEYNRDQKLSNLTEV